MKKLGLTFAGGGGKGAYEIGVWKALKEYGIDKNITAVSGTSVGGLNGALFAIGDIEQGLKVWESMSPDKILQINPEKIISAIGMLHPSTRVLTALSSKLGFLKSEGIFGQKGLESIIRDSLKSGDLKDKIPLYICATDISDKLSWKPLYKKLNELEYEKTVQYLLATSAIPIAFPRIIVDDKELLDGFLTDNTPIKPLIEDEGCDSIIVVLLGRSESITKLKQNYPNTTFWEIVPSGDTKESLGSLDFKEKSAKSLIAMGYNDTVAILKNLQEFMQTEEEFLQKGATLKAQESSFKNALKPLNQMLEIELKSQEKALIEANLDTVLNDMQNNSQELSKFAFDAVTSLASTTGKINYQQDQGNFSRIFGSITGANQKLQTDINLNFSQAIYANTQLIKKLAQRDNLTLDMCISLGNRVNFLAYKQQQLQHQDKKQLQMIEELRDGLITLGELARDAIRANSDRIEKLEYAQELFNWSHHLKSSIMGLNDYDAIVKILSSYRAIVHTNDDKNSSEFLYSALVNLGFENKSIKPRTFVEYVKEKKVDEFVLPLPKDYEPYAPVYSALSRVYELKSIDLQSVIDSLEESYNVDFNMPMDGVSFAFELLNGLKMAQTIQNSLNDSKKRMLNRLNTLYEILEDDKIETFKRDIENLQKRIEDFKVIVPVIGKFSSGKSKLLNTYITKERKLFEVDTNPTTAKACEIHYAQDELIKVHKQDLSVQDITLSELSSLDLDDVVYLQYFLNYPKLKNRKDLVLVDMPGFESSNLNHNNAINHYFNQGQHYILALSCESTNDNSILKHIKEIRSYEADFSIVLTKIDKKTPSHIEELKNVVSQNIKRFYKQNDFFVGAVSSFDDNIGDFEKIIDAVYQNSSVIFERKFIKEMDALLQEVQNYYKKLLNSSNDTTELEKKLSLDKKEFQRDSKELMSKLKDIRKDIVSQGALRLQERIQKVLKANISLLVSAVKNNTLSSSITELLRPAVNSSFKTILENSVKQLEEEVSNISSDLDISFSHVGVNIELSLWESFLNIFTDVKDGKIEDELKQKVIPSVINDVSVNIKNDLEKIYEAIEEDVKKNIAQKEQKSKLLKEELQKQIALQTQEFQLQQEKLQKSLQEIKEL